MEGYEKYRDVQTGAEVWLLRTSRGMYQEREWGMLWTPEEVEWIFEKVRVSEQS